MPNITPTGKSNSELIQYEVDTDFEGALKIVREYTQPKKVYTRETPKGIVVVHEYDGGKIVVRQHSTDGRPTIETQDDITRLQEKFRLKGQSEEEL